MKKNLLNSILFKASLVLTGLFFAGTISAQTTILNGQTVLASNIASNTAVTINAGGTLDMDVARTFTNLGTANSGISTISGTGALTVSGQLTVSGTNTLSTATSVTAPAFFAANVGIATATLAGTGSFSIGFMNIYGSNNGVSTLAINNGLTVQTGTINTGLGNPFTTFFLIVSGTLKISGSVDTNLDGFTCNNGSSVEYNGAAQTVYPTDYHHLVLSGSGAKTLQAATNIIGGNLTLSGTATALTVTDMSVAGSVTIGNGVAASMLSLGNNDDLTVTGNTIVNANSTLTTSGDNVLTLGGNLANNGTFDANMVNDDMNVTFNGAANQTVSGTGGTTNFNNITINKTGVAGNDQVEITSSSFIVPAGFLTLTNGVFKVSGSFTLINTFFNNNNYTIPAIAGFWLNNPNVTVSGQNDEINMDGILRITTGSYNVGNSNDDYFRYGNNSIVTIEGGNLNLAASLRPDNGGNTIAYSQSGGTVSIGAFTSGSGSTGIFDISATGSAFNMSGGTIILQRMNSNFGGADYLVLASANNVTGGTVQIGNASTPAGQTININSSAPVFNLTVNGSNNPTANLITNPLTVKGAVTINASNILNANSLALNVAGNFTNNGTFTPGTQTTTFNGSALQLISGTTATTFNAITFNNGAGFTLATNNTAISGLATFTNGIITPSPATNVLVFNDNATSSLVATNAATTSYVRGPVRKVGNNAAFTFPIGAATGFVPLTISAPDNDLDAFTAQYFRGVPVENKDITTAGINHISGCDYWDLAETNDAGTSNTISATFYWNANNPCNGANNYVTDPGTVKAVHYTAGSWSAASAGFGSGTNAAGSVIFAGLTTFSPFALGSTSAITNPLPVVFSNVKAYEKNDGVQIEWSNLTEKDVAEYTIERSVNGRDFSAIGQQLPVSNQNDKVDYNAFDALTIAGINYYRIKAEETTGKIVYSKVLSVNMGKTKHGLRLYPNPVNGNQVTISLSNVKRGQYNLRVINTTGQDVFKQTITTQGSSLTQTLDLPATVKPGVYNMLVTGVDYRKIRSFIVQ